ncbi:MAG: (Fe-S)-binding protein [Congregibacter sp.]
MGDSPKPRRKRKPRVALFVTCLADLMRPAVAEASVALLRSTGVEVVVPPEQTCCGQPGYNSGDYASAAKIAQQVIRTFESYRYVVLPSGSCAGMVIKHYPRLLEGAWRERALQLGGRTYELTCFLRDVAKYKPTPLANTTAVAYHDACAGLRELGIKTQPRDLLSAAGVKISELEQSETCCGFGGTFCAKMPGISAKMADDKLRDIEDSGATQVLAGDLGCLLALAGRARRQGSSLEFRHVAEVLAASSSALDDDGIATAKRDS